MHNVDGGAVARLPVSGVWVRRGEDLGRVVRDFVGRRLSAFGRAQARRAARRELFRLDNRMLRDIGLRRDQVDEFVDAMFRQADTVAAARPTDGAIAEAIEDVTKAGADSDDHLRTAA